MIKHVYIVHVHPPKGLVDAGHEVLLAAEIAVWPRPHIIPGLGGQEQFIPVGFPVPLHVQTEVPFCLTIGRAIVVGKVKMDDSMIESRPQKALLRLKRGDRAKIVPQAKRNSGKHNAAVAAALVLHPFITIGGWLVHKQSFSFREKVYISFAL